MGPYNVNFDCPSCGKLHGMIGWPGGALMIEDGPGRPSTIVELYEGQELSAVLVELLNDNVWCEQSGGRWFIAHEELERIMHCRDLAGDCRGLYLNSRINLCWNGGIDDTQRMTAVFR